MTPTEVRRLLTELDLRPSRALGQHFLIDQNIRDLILRHADVRSDETVIEIGPGLGALTAHLHRQAARLIAIERDPRLAEFLRKRFAGIELIVGDAVGVLRSGRFEHLPSTYKIVSNLPYSISSAVLETVVESPQKPRLMVLTMQREVALRLAATPRHKDYGALTVFTQLYYHVTIAHVVSPHCFYPEPRVDSAIVVLDRREPRIRLQKNAPFQQLVRAGFRQRRKMLRKLLAGHDGLADALRAAGVSPMARAEELSLEQWIVLANAIGSSTKV
ncbi:MAG: 16S rRNA (adenine(1518)-N(6)/adenine(1519)-N(6))-dimethyltransferase RsmA [Verrucomicrobiae bacterium]|nr:16S rRNA (adenine(1518)-N(6)/adenine(1519)-N(6))-dimethyltransferase RsmA [Verrucomicrobiae bacterium]